MRVFIQNFSLNCALGSTKENIAKKLFHTQKLNESSSFRLIDQSNTPVLKVEEDLPVIPKELKNFHSRNNQLILKTIIEIREDIDLLKSKYGAKRIGVVFGTSTSGVDEGIRALKLASDEALPESYKYEVQEIGSPSSFIKEYLRLESIAYTISTACTSGARTFIEARNLLKNDICDVVIVGGSDSLNDLTLNGFHSLEAISLERTNPMSKKRKGINIGEGCALFLLTKEKSQLELLGCGESTDAYHISSPDPSGAGAIAAMKMALEDAKIDTDKIDYINLHGTGTIKNDEMEALAVSSLFRNSPLVSSTKPFVGHTLGAAGAIELAFCALCLDQKLSESKLPVHHWDECIDEGIASLNFVKSKSSKDVKVCMSNSYAFGGNNVSLILGSVDE